MVDEKKSREEYCLTCNKSFTSKAYLQRIVCTFCCRNSEFYSDDIFVQALKRHIQVIHKKLNQIPNEDRKCRSRKRPQGVVKRPIESINAKAGFLCLPAIKNHSRGSLSYGQMDQGPDFLKWMKTSKEFLCWKSFEKRSHQAKRTSFIWIQPISNFSKSSKNGHWWPPT